MSFKKLYKTSNYVIAAKRLSHYRKKCHFVSSAGGGVTQ